MNENTFLLDKLIEIIEPFIQIRQFEPTPYT